MILYLDMLLLARNKEEGRKLLATGLELLIALGFIVNMKKSTFDPTQIIEFLGLLLNSQTMTISLPEDKLHAIKKAARRLKEMNKVSVARLLGMMVAAHPAILPALLHYRSLETALNLSGSYDHMIQLDSSMCYREVLLMEYNIIKTEYTTPS